MASIKGLARRVARFPAFLLTYKRVRDHHKQMATNPIDPSIRYPSYVDLDDLLDVERLRSLDGYITERLERRMQSGVDHSFRTGPMVRRMFARRQPGTFEIPLRQPTGEYNYFEINRPDMYEDAPAAAEFPELMDFFADLPFQRIARALIIYDTEGCDVTQHRDHPVIDTLHEFIWMRTNDRKQFYMMNAETGEKRYIESNTAWFDTVNQFHGGDGVPGLAFSLRVDGEFTEEFRAKIPVPPVNRASTPAYWEAVRSGRVTPKGS